MENGSDTSTDLARVEAKLDNLILAVRDLGESHKDLTEKVHAIEVQSATLDLSMKVCSEKIDEISTQFSSLDASIDSVKSDVDLHKTYFQIIGTVVLGIFAQVSGLLPYLKKVF